MKRISLNGNIFLAILSILLLVSCSKDEGEKHGTLVYEENFNDDSKWFVGKDNSLISELNNGKYILNYYINGTFVNGFNCPVNIFGQGKKQILEISFKQTGGKGDAGIIFDRRDSDNKSWIVIEQTGHFTIFNHEKGELVIIQDWKENSAIQPIDKTNILRLENENGNLEFFINNTNIYSWKNSGVSTLDRIGLGAANYNSNNGQTTVIEYDYVKAWSQE